MKVQTRKVHSQALLTQLHQICGGLFEHCWLLALRHRLKTETDQDFVLLTQRKLDEATPLQLAVHLAVPVRSDLSLLVMLALPLLGISEDAKACCHAARRHQNPMLSLTCWQLFTCLQIGAASVSARPCSLVQFTGSRQSRGTARCCFQTMCLHGTEQQRLGAPSEQQARVAAFSSIAEQHVPTVCMHGVPARWIPEENPTITTGQEQSALGTAKTLCTGFIHTRTICEEVCISLWSSYLSSST